MFSRYPGYALLCIFLLVISCRKHDRGQEPGQTGGPVLPLPEKVLTTISGKITNQSGEPIHGAKVYAGNSVTTTDMTGNFSMQNVFVVRMRAFVKVEKDGYFQGSRTIIAGENKESRIEIALIRKNVVAIFSAGSGYTGSFQGGTKISIQPEGIVNAANNLPYTGNVTLYAFVISPSDPNLQTIMPGALRGVTINNQEKFLQTYGMLTVELRGSANEKLQLASSKPASIDFPIISPDAPPAIPLWHFNDSTGLWKEEGSAVKSGSFYTGTVTHFSTWNWDIPFDPVYCEIKVVDNTGQPSPNVTVSLFDSTINSFATVITSSDGTATGVIPKDKKIKVTIQSACGGQYSGYIGPFNSNPPVQIISTQPGVQNNTLLLTGTATNCNGQPVMNGFIQIAGATPANMVISNGVFSGTIKYCADLSTMTIIATDIDRNMQGIKAGINATGSNAITLCQDAVGSFFEYFITGIGGDNISGCSGIYNNGSFIANALSSASSVSMYLKTTPATPLSPGELHLLQQPLIDSVIIRRGSEIYRFAPSTYFHSFLTQVIPFGSNIYQTLSVPGFMPASMTGSVVNSAGQYFSITYRFKTYTY